MVRPAGWSGCGSSPAVLPSRRGGIIGRQNGVTFKSNLTRLIGTELLRQLPCRRLENLNLAIVMGDTQMALDFFAGPFCRCAQIRRSGLGSD